MILRQERPPDPSSFCRIDENAQRVHAGQGHDQQQAAESRHQRQAGVEGKMIGLHLELASSPVLPETGDSELSTC